jgi:hypothetical protein
VPRTNQREEEVVIYYVWQESDKRLIRQMDSINPSMSIYAKKDRN